MSKKSRREYMEKMRMRYQQKTGKRARSRLLDECCEATGHDRKCANKQLLGVRGHEKRPKTPRQRLIEYWKKVGEEEKARAMERQRQRCPRADALLRYAPEGDGPGKKQRQEPKEQKAKRSPLNRVS